MNPSSDSVLWVDGWASRPPAPRVRTLYRTGQGTCEASEPLTSIRRRRAFEPGVEPFRAYESRSMGIRHFDLQDLSATTSYRTIFPERFGPLRKLKGQAVFVGEYRGQTIFIPAVLLIEELFLWSDHAAAQLLVPGSIDVMVGRMTDTGEIRLNRALIGTRPGKTALRRVAWLAQCHDARRSWASVLVAAHRGHLSLELPRVRVSGWAWGLELPRGFLVAEFNGLETEIELPHPDAVLRIGLTTRTIPPPLGRTTGFVSFM